MADVVLMGELMGVSDIKLVYKELEYLAYQDELCSDPNYWESLEDVYNRQLVDEELECLAYQDELCSDPNYWESLEVVYNI